MLETNIKERVIEKCMVEISIVEDELVTLGMVMKPKVQTVVVMVGMKREVAMEMTTEIYWMCRRKCRST